MELCLQPLAAMLSISLAIPEVVSFDMFIENIYFSYCENPITEANFSLDSLSVFIHNN